MLYLQDAFSFSYQLDSQSLQLVLTSPPYNIGKEYEGSLPLDTYLLEQERLIGELFRALKPGGSICWQVGNYISRGEVFPLDIYFYPIFKRIGFQLRNRVIWHFGHGLHAQKRLSGRYEVLLWLTKSDEYVFNLDPIRIPSKYPKKKHYKGKKKGKLSGNPKGKNPSDYWPILFKDWESSVWEIPNVKHNHPEKTSHPAQFPLELAERCVLAFSNEGDTIYDPYAGSGTTLLAAEKHQRIPLGTELNPSYALIYEERKTQLRSGTLGYRELGKPVYKPKKP